MRFPLSVLPDTYAQNIHLFFIIDTAIWSGTEFGLPFETKLSSVVVVCAGRRLV
jgi:hypothetical protein